MKLYQKIVAGLVFLISLVGIISVRNLPTGKLWENYSILYVNSDTPDYAIINSLEQNSIYDYVALSNQFLPVTLNIFSPEVSFLKANYDNPEFSYLEKRKAYFFDKSKEYRLYYIPSKEKNKLNDVTQYLHKNNIYCGVDTSANYPIILPIIVLLITVILIYFSKNRILMGLSAFLPFVFICCNPFYIISISQISFILCLFFISNIWKRQDSLHYLISIRTISVMLIIGLICPFACNYKVGLLNFLNLLGTAAIIFLYSDFEEWSKNKKSFVPVYIIPAKRTSIFNRKAKLIMPFCVGLSTLLLGFFLISNLGSIYTNNSKILVPSEKKIASEELPTLDDYSEWMWNVRVAPYKSLNDNQNDSVSFNRFVLEDGKISESTQTFVYSNEFKNTVLNEIDNIKFESIEKVLKSQNEDFKGGYTSTASYNTSLFGIIILLFSYFILLFFYISIIIRRGSRK